MFDSKDCTKCLILSHKAESNEAVPLSKINGRGRIFRFDAHHRRFDFRRRFERIAANLNQVIHSCKKLYIDRQSTVEITAGSCDETHSELSLEHKYSATEDRSMLEQLKDQRRRDLIRGIGNA